MRFFILFAALVLVIPASASAQVMRQVDPKKEQSIVTAKLKLESPAFVNGGEIPLRYTYQGGDVYRGMDISPPLVWSNVPRNTQSFVLIVEDPDAPDPAAPERTWIHWVVYDLPASMKGLPEGIHSFPAGV
ncbi:MAG: YbhB/YbcL family Raf kinase inhibitor-like protein, partial [Alphaproteobacteria bacterium]|nr:YbhB/YbcL family Raf kinase inhibitor-like protein [Alphaproteobacteria bacterium]